MKKGKFVLLAAICFIALIIWFSCNPFQQNESSDALNLNVLDATDIVRATTVTTFNDLSGAVATAVAGDVITISGTITATASLRLANNGTSSAMITLQGGRLECSGVGTSSAIAVTGSYWKITGIELYNGGGRGIQIKGGQHNIVDNCYAHNFKNMGIEVNEGGAYNEIINCRSNENYDVATGGENADGFAAKNGPGKGNVFRNCIAIHNSDDGWDLYQFTDPVLFYSCTAERNGYGTDGDGVGFKLGGPNSGTNATHVLNDCVANYNIHYGFSSNYNPSVITYNNCTGTGNGSGLFND
ncbi:MAG: right-handed parallel beta-helix repeat-containing protein [Spirochaetes bacterium]|nr:right-handed parallel beta-helix repeat-containing protein [Spirochaetota bacterium]